MDTTQNLFSIPIQAKSFPNPKEKCLSKLNETAHQTGNKIKASRFANPPRIINQNSAIWSSRNESYRAHSLEIVDNQVSRYSLSHEEMELESQNMEEKTISHLSACPICNSKFASNISLSEKEVHVSNCLVEFEI